MFIHQLAMKEILYIKEAEMICTENESNCGHEKGAITDQNHLLKGFFTFTRNVDGQKTLPHSK